jgi:protease-4
MKKFLLGALVGFLFSLLALVVFFFALVRLSGQPPEVADNSILVLKMEGSIPERPAVELPIPYFERMAPLTVRDYWETLHKAAADRRIRGILLAPQNLDAGWAKLQELREGLVAFRKSGKPVYAHLRTPGSREYYLATAADRISMGPEDYLDVKGLRAEMIYIKQTLDKVGVQVEVVHAGKYKDAPDMFTRTGMSPETREVMNSVLDDLYGQLTGAIATARKKSPEQIRATIDQGPFLSRDAQAAGLIDVLQYQDQAFGDLERRLKTSGARKLSPRNYMRITPQSVGVETGSRVAFVVAEGDIVRGGGDGLSDQGVCSASEMTAILRRVGADKSVRAVLLRVDSPGGDSVASDEIWREMSALSKKKPLVISMSDTAASGGYYIAMTGDPVLAYPGTLTGSIGVFFGKLDLRGLYDKLGVKKEILTRGRFAAIDSDYSPLSDVERAKVQHGVDVFYHGFLERVEQVAPLAEGRVWLGDQALGNGLVDASGGIDRAIEALRKKAGLKPDDKVRLISYPPRRTLIEQLFEQPSDAAWADVEPLAFLRRFASQSWIRGGMFRLMPYTIRVK